MNDKLHTFLAKKMLPNHLPKGGKTSRLLQIGHKLVLLPELLHGTGREEAHFMGFAFLQ